MAAHTGDTITWEAETELPWVQGQPRLDGESTWVTERDCSQKTVKQGVSLVDRKTATE